MIFAAQRSASRCLAPPRSAASRAGLRSIASRRAASPCRASRRKASHRFLCSFDFATLRIGGAAPRFAARRFASTAPRLGSPRTAAPRAASRRLRCTAPFPLLIGLRPASHRGVAASPRGVTQCSAFAAHRTALPRYALPRAAPFFFGPPPTAALSAASPRAEPHRSADQRGAARFASSLRNASRRFLWSFRAASQRLAPSRAATRRSAELRAATHRQFFRLFDHASLGGDPQREVSQRIALRRYAAPCRAAQRTASSPKPQSKEEGP